MFPSEVPAGVDKAGLISKTITKRDGNKAVMHRIENDDVFSQVNTILKMAKKRALVDAALSAGRLSEVFTQDIEDFKPVQRAEPEKPPVVKQTTPAKVKEAEIVKPDVKKATKDSKDLWPDGKKPAADESKIADIKAYIQGQQNFTSLQTVDSWIVHTCKISIEDFNADPEGKLAEIKELMGW